MDDKENRDDRDNESEESDKLINQTKRIITRRWG